MLQQMRALESVNEKRLSSPKHTTQKVPVKKIGLAPIELANRSAKSRENYHLARRIVEIMNSPGVVEMKSVVPVHHPRTMNFRYRYDEARRIQMENIAMAARIKAAKPYYDSLVVVKPGASPRRVVSPGKSPRGSIFPDHFGFRRPLPTISIDENVKYIFATYETKRAKRRKRRVVHKPSVMPVSPRIPVPGRPKTSRGPTSIKVKIVREPRPSSPKPETVKPVVMLEYTKVQDKSIIDCVVTKEPFLDRYAIRGVGRESRELYEKFVTSEDVSRELEGDMLVTTVEAARVWRALLNKLALPVVSTFAVPREVHFDVFANDFRRDPHAPPTGRPASGGRGRPPVRPVVLRPATRAALEAINVSLVPTSPAPASAPAGGRERNGPVAVEVTPTKPALSLMEGTPGRYPHHRVAFAQDIFSPDSDSDADLGVEGDGADVDAEDSEYYSEDDEDGNDDDRSENNDNTVTFHAKPEADYKIHISVRDRDSSHASISNYSHSQHHQHQHYEANLSVDAKSSPSFRSGQSVSSSVEWNASQQSSSQVRRVLLSPERPAPVAAWTKAEPELDSLLDDDDDEGLDNVAEDSTNKVLESSVTKIRRTTQDVWSNKKNSDSNEVVMRVNDFLEKTMSSMEQSRHTYGDDSGDYQENEL